MLPMRKSVNTIVRMGNLGKFKWILFAWGIREYYCSYEQKKYFFLCVLFHSLAFLFFFSTLRYLWMLSSLFLLCLFTHVHGITRISALPKTSYLKHYKLYVLLLCQIHDINSMSRVNGLVPNRRNSAQCNIPSPLKYGKKVIK